MPLIDLTTGHIDYLSTEAWAGQANAAGFGLTADCFREISGQTNTTQGTLALMFNAIQQSLANQTNPATPTGTSIEGLLLLPQHQTRRNLMSELRATVPEAAEFDADTPGVQPTPSTFGNGGPVQFDTAQPFDLNLAAEIAQENRNFFTEAQRLQLSRMVAEWLTNVEQLIKCAENADAELVRIVSETNAARQARWELAGKIIGTIVKLAAPPPFGAIIGGVIEAVMTSDTWTGCVTTSAGQVMSATYPTNTHAWKYNKDTGAWEDKAVTSNIAAGRHVGPGGDVRYLSSYAHVPGVLDSVPSVFAESTRETFDKVNKKTLKHVTDLPMPDSQLSGDLAITMIKEQVAQRIAYITDAVNETVADYCTARGTTALLWAAWDYQKDTLPVIAANREPQSPNNFIRNHLKKTCKWYMATLANELMNSIAERAKPPFNVTTANTGQIQKQFEIFFWAQYLGTSALDEKPKGKKTVAQDDEGYYLNKYGKTKIKFWQGLFGPKLGPGGLRIVMPYAGVSRGRLRSQTRSADYERDVAAWTPPTGPGHWKPVPYRKGGDRSRGRLAAWAVEFNKRPPNELFESIIGS